MPTPLHDLAASLVRLDQEFRLTVRALLQRLSAAEADATAAQEEAARLAVRCRRLEDALAARGVSEDAIAAIGADPDPVSPRSTAELLPLTAPEDARASSAARGSSTPSLPPEVC